MQFVRLCRKALHRLPAVALASALCVSAAVPMHAQDSHIVTSADLQQQVQAQSTARQQQIDSLTRFLSSPMAEKAMHSSRIDPQQVRSAIPTLSDSELKDLSARADHAQQQFAAGSISDNTLLLIILILVVVILLAVIR